MATGQYYGDNKTRTYVLTCSADANFSQWRGWVLPLVDRVSVQKLVILPLLIVILPAYPLYYDKTNQNVS